LFPEFDEEQSLQYKVDTQDELLAPLLDADRKKKIEDQLRRVTLDILTRVSRCIEVDGVIFKGLL
jgi:hypothetical protein